LKLSELDRSKERRGRTPTELSESLRQYLYAKYVYRATAVAELQEDSREALRLASALGEQKVAEG
jgi:hypothetical protein